MNPQQGREPSEPSSKEVEGGPAALLTPGEGAAVINVAEPLKSAPPAAPSISLTAVDAKASAAGADSCANASTRDILAQLAFGDIIADSCDSSCVQVGNVDAGCTNDELRAIFSKFGDIKEITTPEDNKTTRTVSFFDIRAARRACQQPPGSCLLNGKVLSVCYATGDASGHDNDVYDESTLRVYGIPPVVSNGDMFRLFGHFGDVKDIRVGEEDELGRRCHIVEFFDTRNTRNAIECLNNAELLGSKLSVDSYRTLPLWQRRRLWQNQAQLPPQAQTPYRATVNKGSSQFWEQVRFGDHSPEMTYTRPVQFCIAPSSRGGEPGSCNSTGSTSSNGLFSPPSDSVELGHRDRIIHSGTQKSRRLVSPITLPDISTNSVPILPSMSSFDFNYSPMASTNVTPPHAVGFDNGLSPFSPGTQPSRNRVSSTSMTNLMTRGSPDLQPRPQFFSPTSFHSISGSMHSASQASPGSSRYYEFGTGSPSGASGVPRRQSSGAGSGRNGYQPSGSLAPRRGPPDIRQDYYSIVIVGGRVLDTRTTLMIRNIPNKYTQRMLIEQLDRENPGCYDFLYLPIDFKNNCNVGYAFVNMVSTDFLPAFYATLHNKRWERFNSEKVCEIAYARIQGLEQLLEHFKNSSLLAEDKKVRPVILLNGHYVPFPDPDVAIRVATSGARKYLVTFVSRLHVQ